MEELKPWPLAQLRWRRLQGSALNQNHETLKALLVGV